MPTGTVKWFNSTKGYGFIKPHGGSEGDDVFVHIRAIAASGLDHLEQGQQVSYELMTERNGKVAATQLRIVT